MDPLGVYIVPESIIVSRAYGNSGKIKTCIFEYFLRGNLSSSLSRNSDQQPVVRHLPRAYQKTDSFGGIFLDSVISSVLCVLGKKRMCVAGVDKRHVVSRSGLLLGL